MRLEKCDLEAPLCPLAVDQFFGDYCERSYHHRQRRQPDYYQRLITAEALEDILSRSDARLGLGRSLYEIGFLTAVQCLLDGQNYLLDRRNRLYPWARWKRTSQRMKARYCEPYNARHSSVSSNLVIGKNPLWVSKQHGHSATTMLRVYTAWLDGITEADIEAIKRSIGFTFKTSPSFLRSRLLQQPVLYGEIAAEKGVKTREASSGVARHAVFGGRM